MIMEIEKSNGVLAHPRYARMSKTKRHKLHMGRYVRNVNKRQNPERPQAQNRYRAKQLNAPRADHKNPVKSCGWKELNRVSQADMDFVRNCKPTRRERGVPAHVNHPKVVRETATDLAIYDWTRGLRVA